ncbi:cytochrome-c oxidase, cbb3-type subunit III [Minwuia thermotolerans]|jgi:cytochrome c oxidase cbb3-type subunit 3|uniref:Cbb3-type cytochrome c oxidase subunit n=1 Tax=Minwuia thermotolerans TaxID=2056226 RepID=A0A2M9FXU6_9PROT|nr:cytochrome-c oxidase, cbb3-type subunit III [Minwuia thermotolerans]ANK81675.1 MAG: cytochrome c oxidase, cbb3-type subunit III [Rhizobiales bacterium NRL2]PJK28286.1 cytochrome-c oxidase, cbb3-type subunit III [Minwuia thermotolerans]
MRTDPDAAKGKEAATETDAVTGTATTGHEWDGIKELDNPMPRWWLWTFYATVIWAIGYTIAYPAWPLIDSATQGVLGYSSRAAVERDIEDAITAQQEKFDALERLSLEEIRQDPALFRFATDGGRAAFAVNCSQCHGSGAQGSPGYPNLNDDEWLWGGSVQDIYQTLQHGIRYERDDETRFSQMPAFGDGLLSREQINAVAHHVRSLAELEHDADLAAAGATVYADNCAVCHGENGGGDQSQGAPALDDAIWLYGSSVQEIRTQVVNPRHGVMPAWDFRLSDATLKQLTLFVHSLGGGELGIDIRQE